MGTGSLYRGWGINSQGVVLATNNHIGAKLKKE
jgi:hypothetical protein